MTVAGAITLDGDALPPGQRTMVRVPVFTDLDGVEIGVHIHAVVGAQPGPVLAVMTGHHGRHWMSAETTRAFVESLDPTTMSGSVLAVPITNPLATASRTRHIHDESDNPDVNRVFGVGGTFMANQLADVITDNVLRQADAQVNMASGPFWTIRSTTSATNYTDPSMAEKAFLLARAFGIPFVRRSASVKRLPGIAVNYSGEVLGIPSILVELGGVGFGTEREQGYIRENVQGLHQVMQYLGIMPGTPPLPDRILVFDKHERLNPRNAGMLDPLMPVEALMDREVQRGELVARVWSPYTFETVEEIRAPVRGLIDMVTVPYPVRPGDWSSMMVDLDDPGTRWLERDEMP